MKVEIDILFNSGKEQKFSIDITDIYSFECFRDEIIKGKKRAITGTNKSTVFIDGDQVDFATFVFIEE